MSEDIAHLFFEGELIELLTCAHQFGIVRYAANREASIKDVVEAIGVPPTEVYAIRMNGKEYDFSLQLSPDARITFLPARLTSDYPVDVTRTTLLRPALKELRFLVDENVARLALLLRAFGFDAAYHRTWNDEYIAELAAREGRVVLSRDRGLLKRGAVEHGRLIRSQVADEQLQEVLKHFKMPNRVRAFSRCFRCNVITEPVDKAEIKHLLEPKTRARYHTFRRCPTCKRVYWRGVHYERLMARFVSLGINMRRFM
ncbi:Mut7-C RNAse domain-containing protein [Halodesulfovibrio marinisediminis]|uniref:Twitching motility protein PilT n=1 Tax=Halodesulfovibrio marinisediminis DSM 17456 TaxID=1121457 RepID=A0A1N6I822_9BACT|nr:Mut7-C RNAse domain-containing protein [Halodesulfovibrio marinisediminis]SIO28174.1 hypothetical protein SAMN02745161_2503 [Halodesulfovibrio marinisediminis DSM 17456]